LADDVHIKFGAEIGPAIAAIAELKGAIGSIGPSLGEFNTSYLRTFRNSMQVLVDLKRVTSQQALVFDMQYTAQLYDEERQRLRVALDSDATRADDKLKTMSQLIQLEARYTAAISDDQRRIADQARAQADRIAHSYEQAFDRLGGSVQRSFNQMLTHQTTWAKGSARLVQEVENFFLEQVEKMAAQWAASGLASLAGGAVASAVSGAQAAGASGLGPGLMALVGINQPGGLFGSGIFAGTGGVAQTTALAANTTAIGASTAAMASLTAALTGAAVAGGGVAAAGGIGVAGAAAGSAAAGEGGLFSWLAGLLAFARGGIVPSAAGGWALPNFAGAAPALLHAREMVLPAHISEGLQDIIGRGGSPGAGQHFHAHFHGPADAPAVSRWFRDNMRQNAGAIRDIFRQNALTPRTL